MNGLTSTVANLYNAFEPDLKITSAKGKHFADTENLLTKITSVRGVKAVSRTLSDKALIKNGDKQTLVTVKGIDENFHHITNVKSALEEGDYGIDDPVKNRILLGRGIANQLHVNIREYVNELTLFSPVKGKTGSLNPDDHLNQLYVTPSGIFTLNEEFDYLYAFINLETARRLFDEPQRISALELSCETGKSAEVQKQLTEVLGEDFVVKNRYQLNDVLYKSLETEKLATFIILAFILIIATFNIIGALTMLIIEKKRDIKTLYSLGADMSLIRNIFMREGFLITGIGAIIGLVIGLAVCWLQIKFHLVKFGDEFVIPYYPIDMQLKDFIWIFSLIMTIGFIAALYPVRIFTRTDVKAL
jgi:lipoprotein-releasing system permease protein